MHIQIDRDTGRVAPRQVFEYVPLEAGQYFAGELICTDANAWRLLQQFLGLDPDATGQKVTTVRLGKGRQRGYGQVKLWLKCLDKEPSVWIQQPTEKRVNEGAEELTLTLLTDTIVTGARGRFVTGFENDCTCDKEEKEEGKCQCECEWLSRGLRFPVHVVKERGFAATQIVDGFNSIQQLPRWRDVALAAGSTVLLQILEPPEGGLLEMLERIEREGIGLRRNEGYGQVAFNHPVYTGGVQDVSVDTNDLPSDLRPGTFGPDAHAHFRHEWEKSLRGEKWDACAKPRFRDAFAALARWLVAQQEQPPGDLIKVLDVLLAQKKEEREAARKAVPEALAGTLPALGQPDHDLTTKIIKDYGARDKANKLTQQDAREGVQLIWNKLADLTQRSDWEPFWPEGVALVAAQVAEVTKKREGE
jgi:CRISPR-associated protein Csx10